jgi:hypothetical protein
MNADKDQLDSLTERVPGAGFPDKVYQRALLRERRSIDFLDTTLAISLSHLPSGVVHIRVE